MAFTDSQNATIRKAYQDAKLNNDPQGLMKQMTEFGVDVKGISGATGYSDQEIGGWLSANGAAKGFGGYTAPDNPYEAWNNKFGTTYDKDANQQPIAQVQNTGGTVIGGGILSSGQYQTSAPGILASGKPTARNTLVGEMQNSRGPLATLAGGATTSAQAAANAVKGIGGSTPPAGQPAQSYSSNFVSPPPQLGLPAGWKVTPDQTVEGRIGALTDPNNPFIQQARARADGRSNERGLLNSSMASTAADSAAYDAAMPIAQADAANASKVAGYNADQQNQFALARLSNDTNRYSIDSSASTQRYVADQNAATQMTIKKLDQTQQTMLAELENKNRNLLQNSQVASSAYGTYAQTLYNNSVNKDMTPEARFQADQNAFNIYQQQISLSSTLLNVPDVSSLLSFTTNDPTAPASTVVGGGNVDVSKQPQAQPTGILGGKWEPNESNRY